MGISRQKTCETGAGSKARSRIEQRGALHGETTVITMSGLMSSQSGEVRMKQSRVDKRRERERKSQGENSKQNGEKHCE